MNRFAAPRQKRYFDVDVVIYFGFFFFLDESILDFVMYQLQINEC